MWLSVYSFKLCQKNSIGLLDGLGRLIYLQGNVATIGNLILHVCLFSQFFSGETAHERTLALFLSKRLTSMAQLVPKLLGQRN